MESYTYGSDEAIQAMIRNLPQKYEVELTAHDMSTVVWALHRLWLDDSQSDKTVQDAGDLLSSIAETLGVEFV